MWYYWWLSELSVREATIILYLYLGNGVGQWRNGCVLHFPFRGFNSLPLIINSLLCAVLIILSSALEPSHHHHHHVHEGLGVFPVPWSSRCSWSLHLFLGRPTFLRPCGLYCSACFGSLFVSILCTCFSHFFCYCFTSFTLFCAPVFSLIHWFFSLSLLLLNVVPLFSPVPKLHFQISMLL